MSKSDFEKIGVYLRRSSEEPVFLHSFTSVEDAELYLSCMYDHYCSDDMFQIESYTSSSLSVRYKSLDIFLFYYYEQV